MKFRFNFSYIVQPFELDKNLLKIGQLPEKYLLSPLLKSVNIEDLPKTGLDVKHDYSPRRFTRTPEYFLTREKYMQFAKNHPQGKVHLFNYLDVHFTLAGSSWEHIPNRNLFKLLSYTRPQVILIQVRPDHILRGFNPKFESSRKYIEQITRQASEIMPSGYAEKIAEELEQPSLEFPEYAPYELNERINYSQVATVSHYAELNNVPIMLCDQPNQLFRESLVNQLTLMQLQEYQKTACNLTPQHPDILPNTPLNVAFQIFPHIFLRRSDEFMSTIVEYLAAKKSYKRVFGIMGNMESDAIVDLLENRSAQHLQDELETPKIKRSILKELTCEDLVERHAILDVMKYGQVFKQFQKKKIRFNLYLVLPCYYASNQKIC